MGDRNFRQMLEKKWSEGKFVCVGLDSELGKIPESIHKKHVADTIREFNLRIVDATKDLVCAYKPNLAFYAAQGANGLDALWQTIRNIKIRAPDVPVILDAKYADIGNTNAGYVKFAFEYLGADAVTVHPYLGREALQPFLNCKDKGIFVLCRTSNPGAGEFQDLVISGVPLYNHVARHVASHWNVNDNCALVVGATYPDELRQVRMLVGDMPILIPGIGAQGGDVEKTVEAAGGNRMIINSSRGIIFASNGPDFAEAARRETLSLHNLINQYRKEAV